MHLDEIIERLEFYDGTFSRKGLQQAIEKRDDLIPHLLAAIERAEREAQSIREQGGNMAHIYAMFLLAQFREQRALPLLVKFFPLPGELALDTTRDVVTEDLHRILASVSGDDSALIKNLAENPRANEYVRSASLRALVCLMCSGAQSRDETVHYFKELVHRGTPREPSAFWNELAATCTDLYPEEVLDEIEEAYAKGLVDPGYMEEGWVRQTMAKGKESVLASLDPEEFRLIENTISEMESWACLRPRIESAPSKWEYAWRPVEKSDKTGRDDPCPCGSGLKYKKCCG